MTSVSEPQTADASSPPRKLVRDRLDAHLRQWLGGIPDPARPQLVVIESRDEPGWDGVVRPIQGVCGPDGIVLAVSPRYAGRFRGVDLETLFRDASLPDAEDRLQRTLGVPVRAGMPVFRWCEEAAALKEAGEWLAPDDPRLPEWLLPFNGGVLVAFGKDGQYRAGVGLKRHNDIAREISVGTDPGHRGQGLATRLVAQAARAVIAGGGLPLYQHGRRNVASARVADSAGFPDRGWRMLEIRPE